MPEAPHVNEEWARDDALAWIPTEPFGPNIRVSAVA